MIILLDIDGVLETTPPWRKVETDSDGFMKLNENALKNLSILHEKTNASVVLTTTHRVNYNLADWKGIFERRGIIFEKISKINDKTELNELLDRGTEIKEWVESQTVNLNYIIIDDDSSINSLSNELKERWIQTKPHIGFDEEALEKALFTLTINAKFACPCCGHKTYTEEPNGSYNICPVCFWEDDLLQLNNPTYAGGANRTSLKHAQRNFIEFGACDAAMKVKVRPPNAEEPKDKKWRILND